MRNLKLALLLLTMVGCSTATQAHALLEHASPQLAAPSPARLDRSRSISPRSSSPNSAAGRCVAPGGTRVDHGAGVSGNVMRLGIGGLRPGRYSVTWHALSVDTHKTQGSFSFQVGK